MFRPINNIFKNWNKPIYIATKKDVTYDEYNNEIVVYNEPFYYGNKNYQHLVGNQLQAYIEAYGEVKGKVSRLFIDYTDNGLFGEFDLAYLYGATPEGETKEGENANYRIRTYKEQNLKIMVVFEEIIKDETLESEEDSND